MGQYSFFNHENRLHSISKLGDPLERLVAEIPWEIFLPLLEPVHERERKSIAGCKPFDVVLMFKILILQTLYNLADEQVEYQIRDRLSFARFLGLGIEDAVPDATTVWRFRERLKELGLIDTLFDRFGDFLAAAGYQAREGQIVDASIAPVPIQRTSAKKTAESEGRRSSGRLERGQAGTERRRRTLDGKAG